MAHLLACPSLSSIWFTRWQGNANDKSERHGRGEGRPLSRTTWNYHREPIEAVCFVRLKRINAAPLHQTIIYIYVCMCVCVCITRTNCLRRGLQFARRLPLTIRVGLVCGEKNATKKYNTWHERETRRYTYLEGLFIVDFPLIWKVATRGWVK